MAKAKEKKKLFDFASNDTDKTHNFGVPSADDEVETKPVQSESKPKHKQIKNHAKFSKFKGREINGN